MHYNIDVYFKSENISLLILGLTSLVASRILFQFFDDPEGSNLLIVVGMAVIIYFLSLAVFTLSTKLMGLRKLLLGIFVQILLVITFYFCLN